jgi:hypothetical protein
MPGVNLQLLRNAASSFLTSAASKLSSRQAIATVGRTVAPAAIGGVTYAAAENYLRPAPRARGRSYNPDVAYRQAQYPRRRAKGITAVELRGARKVAKLVRVYGMRPKTGKIHGRKR